MSKTQLKINNAKKCFERKMANPTYIDSSTWAENKEYLNWPGLQYLYYTKLKADASSNS